MKKLLIALLLCLTFTGYSKEKLPWNDPEYAYAMIGHFHEGAVYELLDPQTWSVHMPTLVRLTHIQDPFVINPSAGNHTLVRGSFIRYMLDDTPDTVEADIIDGWMWGNKHPDHWWYARERIFYMYHYLYD